MSLATLKMVHLVLLCGFLGVNSALLILAVVNRLRVRRVLLTWPQGRLFGLPLLPVAFLAGVLVLLGYAWYQDMELATVILSGYVVGGLFWGMAATLRSSVVVSSYGFVNPAAGHRGCIAWSQVTDYACIDEAGCQRYVFFFQDAGERCRSDLVVPRRHRDVFEHVVELKVDERFAFDARRHYQRKAMEE